MKPKVLANYILLDPMKEAKCGDVWGTQLGNNRSQTDGRALESSWNHVRKFTRGGRRSFGAVGSVRVSLHRVHIRTHLGDHVL